MDLENLDFKAMDKEMATDEATQAAHAAVVASEENVTEPTEVDGGEAGV